MTEIMPLKKLVKRLEALTGLQAIHRLFCSEDYAEVLLGTAVSPILVVGVKYVGGGWQAENMKIAGSAVGRISPAPDEPHGPAVLVFPKANAPVRG